MKQANKYLLPVPLAGKLIGLKRTSAYEAAGLGDLPTIKINGRLYVPVAALEQLVGQPIDVDALD